MKKIIICFVTGTLLFCCTGCTLASLPTEGIWYSDELKLVIDFDQYTVYSYDEKLNHLELELCCWVDGEIDIFYLDDEGNSIDLYCGYGRYRNEKFSVFLYSKANPEDHYDSPIELNYEEYAFVLIEDYDNTSETKND